MIKIKTLTVGLLLENCYIVEKGAEIAVIDPGDDGDKIIHHLEAIQGKQLKYILITHPHTDHIGAVKELKDRYPEAEVFVPQKDIEYEKAAPNNFINEEIFPKIGVRYRQLVDGQLLPFDDGSIEVIGTPGHTPGSVCYLIEGNLFSGDTLFYQSAGTTQFPGGNEEELKESLKKLRNLPEETEVYPGHLQPTTIGLEKKSSLL